MSQQTRLMLGLAGGYVFAKYGKTRWALVAAALFAGKRLGKAAIQRGATAMSSSPELKHLAEQGKQTAVALAGNQVRGLTSRVHAATESMRQPEHPGAGEQQGREASGAEQAGEDGEDQDGEDQDGEDQDGEVRAEEGTEGPAERGGPPRGRAEGAEPGGQGEPESAEAAGSASAEGGDRHGAGRVGVSGRPDGVRGTRRR